MADVPKVQADDVLPVGSRVSWGALFAGVFVALAVWVLLSTLGMALGLSLADRAQGETLAVGGGIWAILTVLIALFCGGCVTAQVTAGETKGEAVIYGVILWGVTFALLMLLTGSVVRGGFAAVLGASNLAASAQGRSVDWERVARENQLSQEQVDKIKAALPTGEQVRARSSEAAWWSLAGIVLSMLAAIGGSLAGSGPTPLLRIVKVRPTGGPGAPLSAS